MTRKQNPSSNGLSVSLEALEICFGKFQALHATDLNIRDGEFFTLLGPSGCGKTTLLRCLAGFIKPKRGRILFDDKDVSQIEPWDRGIGFVFQNYALWPTKTIARNVAYGLEMRKEDKATIERKVRETLELVELEHAADKYPGELSGGMQQRAALARAVIIDPPLLLFDEPLSNLDAKLRVKLRRDIRALQSRLGLTAVYVTHDQEEALDISDRIAVMHQGRVAQIGTPREIYETPVSTRVADFVGKATFLRGHAVSADAFQLDSGAIIQGAMTFQTSPANGRVLFSRPETISIVAPGEGDIDGVVHEVSYLGNLTRYVVTTGCGQNILVEARCVAQQGDRVGIRFSEMKVFDDLPDTKMQEEDL
ncbi:ABC transporter ATP-binding protein [Pseudovibrio exalbescens]|uniref:ABC transporter ATP-binding protein n=1 Tax=Pseudovibrio exalbescens TaxID=197461 RepID=UPI0023672957|nr:ABC transporter ATP-binding protein [Pseudovibrio exalbescens]MDD7911580.1 ABC transporter ATP-binding protein [Pseudovibrio exalbescens]